MLRYLLLFVLLFLVACGSGGGGGDSTGATSSSSSVQSPAVFTSITGTVSPLPAQASAPAIQTAAPVPPVNMLLPKNAPPANFPALAQATQYTLDPAFLPALKISQVDFPSSVDTSAFVGLSISPTGALLLPGFAADPTLGQPTAINVLTNLGVGLSQGSSTFFTDNLAGLPAALLTQAISNSKFAEYVLPFSPTVNPAGYTYQTFGLWGAVSSPIASPIIEGFFSFGVPTTAALPTAGTAAYTGQSDGTFINAVTGDQFDTITTVTVTVNFASRTVAIALNGTTTLISSATTGTPPNATPALNFQGTLTYPAASNTFTGPGSTTNAMIGNATGRFYGPPIGAATASKVVGSPSEIGGTFAVLLSGVGSLQGSFGAR